MALDSSTLARHSAAGDMTVSLNGSCSLNSLTYSGLSDCVDWTFWGDALRIGVVGGRFVVEYIFFVLLSVSIAAHSP